MTVGIVLIQPSRRKSSTGHTLTTLRCSNCKDTRPSEKPIGRKGDRSSNRNYPLTTLPTPIPEFGVMPVVVMIFMIAIVLALAVRKSGT